MTSLAPAKRTRCLTFPIRYFKFHQESESSITNAILVPFILFSIENGLATNGCTKLVANVFHGHGKRNSRLKVHLFLHLIFSFLSPVPNTRSMFHT